MATQRSHKRLSTLQQSRKFRDRARKASRQESRRLHLEQLEDRRVMAVFVLPNNGELLNNGDTRTIAPQDLTFRFTDIPAIDPATIANGIRLIRAGQDGLFGQANDRIITPGFIGLGDNAREVVMRFSETLPDDIYRVTIVGSGATPLRDTAGKPINNGADTTLNFRLDLGAQVLAVVPQPVRRLPSGALSMTEQVGAVTRSTQNMVHIYFNNDDLDVASAQSPQFYRLYVTRNTLDAGDDVEILPTSVEYDPVANMARLIFGQAASLDQLAANDGSRDPIKSFRLRVGTDEVLRNLGVPTTVTQLGGNDPGSSFATANDLGSLITTGSQGTSASFAQAIQALTYNLAWPGGIDDPGHRDIPAETHLNGSADGNPTITTRFYNFKPIIGTIPTGTGGTQPSPNLITELQKERAREIFELYSRYSGIQFVESDDNGITVATGDLRTLDPEIPVDLVAGIAGGSLAIMDNNDQWDDSYGGSWFQVAMHEIGHVLGQGHTYDLPPLTIQGDDAGLQFTSPGAEGVFPGDADIIHMRHQYRPDSTDIDMYRFTLDGTGELTLETFAERLPNSSLLDTNLRLYRVGAENQIEEIARNDDYFSKDSRLQLTLGPGTYFVGVTAAGNEQYDPTIVDTGIGGTTQGLYELKFDFRKSATNSLVDVTTPANQTPVIADTLNVAFDGDANGTPGGVYNFWFRAAPLSISPGNARARTIFVDKVAPNGGNGLISSPYNNIKTAVDASLPFDIIRIVGNDPLGNDGGTAANRFADNRAYQIGFNDFSQPLTDGAELSVPKDVTVMIDAGAVFQMRRSQVSVGSTAPSLASDHSGAALQVLGTPTSSVYFTSYNESGANSIGLDQNPLNNPAAPGDWGGISFRNDLDRADGRFDHELEGIFLNYVNHANIRFGGGQVNVNSVFEVVTPITMLDRRPTVTFNTITLSSDAAMSANPDSFEETNFQAPRYWPAPSTSYSLDYDRVGPDIHGNLLLNNTKNALFVRTRTPAGDQLEELTVAGRFNDTDIVHVIEENLVVRGTPGGATLEEAGPPTQLIIPTEQVGQGNFAGGTNIEYKLVYIDLLGNESLASPTFSASILLNGSGMLLTQLPAPSSLHPDFIARKLYRRTAGNQPFTLVAQIPASVSDYLDQNLPVSGELQVLKVSASPSSINRARMDASLVIDPLIVIKSDGARIDVGIGANFVAEGFAGREVIFTSLADDRYGAGGTFDTNSDNAPAANVPVITTLTQGGTGVNERQRITLPLNPTSGTFTLTFNGQTTAPIAFNASAAALQTALESLSNINPGDVAVTFATGAWTVTFTGALAATNVVQLTGAAEPVETQPQPGDWGGIFFSADSRGSIDNAVIAYAGGLTRVEGAFAGFNAIEIHQSDVRISQSKFEFNEDGQGGQAPTNRFGRDFNRPATIFVRGAQPVIMDNIAISNDGAFISINVNALNHETVVDGGRQTGLIEREAGHLDNNGPLLLRNRLRDNGLNGMVVRGGTLTTESVWDDTDIVHVLLDAVTVPDFHTFGGLRIESSATASLVVKAAGPTAGFTATGRPLEIDDRIGGILQILGQPGFPVVLTGLSDDNEGAGVTPEGVPQTDTDGNGTGTPGGGGGTTLPTGPEVNNGTLIDNDVPTNTIGHFEIRPGNAGISLVSGVTAQGQTQLFINQDFIFDFLNFVDVGPNGSAIDLSTTTITTPPTLLSPDLVFSEGNFAGANGIVNWRVETRIDNGTTRINNTLILTSANALGALRFINYLDEDVLAPSDDLLYQVGTPGQPDFRLFTLDNVERIGFSQGGTYAPGTELVNATYDGFAADAFPDLRTVIGGAGTTYSLTGNIDLVDVPAFVDPDLGAVHGLTDVTTAMAWTVNPTATSARITTFLELVAEAPAPAGNPGEWQGITIDEFAHDRNVETILELESASGNGLANENPQKAQFVGALGPFEKGGDENLRLGMTVHGLINNPGDVDVYSFSGKAGTEVWIDIDRSTHALDAVVELIDNSGNVLARSNNSVAENAATEARFGLARAMQKTAPYEGKDFYGTNQRDPAMRLLLPGPANTTNTYFLRVRSEGALTSGNYQLQVRLRELDERGGTTVRFAQISNALNGIHVLGQPTHSPLGGEATEIDNAANNLSGGAQFVGNLLNSDRGAIALAGSVSGIGDVDWYRMTINYDATQGIPGVSTLEDWWSTIFDIDYADGFSRANLFINIFDENGNLVLSSHDSNVADDRPTQLNPADSSDLGRGSSGTADPWIGPAEMPQGTYLVAISNEARMPAHFNQFTTANAINQLVRLEPINSVRRLVEDHIGSTGGSNIDTVEVNFIDTNSIVPWSLHDVPLFVTQHGGPANTTRLLTIDPFSGTVETTVGRFDEHTADFAMHPRGRLYSYTIESEFGNNARFSDAQTGNYFQIDAGTGAITQIGDDGIETYEQDPASADPSPVLANPVNGTRVGEGIHFRAMDIAVWPGNGFTPDYVGLAIGGRDALLNPNDARNIPQNDYPNILYVFNPDTGAALSPGVRTGLGLLSGARTQIVERGILDTTIDFFPQGNADAIAIVEATFVDPITGDTTFQILDFGYPATPPLPEIPAAFPSPTTFRVQQGALNRLFEFDAGPEALFEINPNVINQQIFDTQGFVISGGPGATRVEFDTGHVINVTGVGNAGNYPTGSTLVIRDVDPDPTNAAGASRAPITLTFEFTNGSPAAGNIAIPVAGTASQMVDAIVAAINAQQALQGFSTNAERLGTTGRISLAHAASVANNSVAQDSDHVVVSENVPGLGVVAASGVTDGNIRLRIEETSSQAELQAMFGRANVDGILPISSRQGVSGAVDGFNRVTVGFDGTRINFSGATSIVIAAPSLNPNVFRPVGSQGGVVSPGAVSVPFLAQDDESDLAGRMVTALQSVGFQNVQASPTGLAVFIRGGTVISASDPLQTAAEAPGGTITGIAAINQQVYAVTDTGGLFRVISPLGGAQLDFINSATDLVGIDFTSLAAGPRHVEGGRYQNMLFGIDTTGEMYAFDLLGNLQPIFVSTLNPISGQIEAQTSVQTGLTDVRGLKFSNLDYNLWHTTPNRDTNAGHGINEVFDRSRRAVEGGSSLYFGFESVGRNNVGSAQQYAPAQGTNNIDFLGGSHGSIETNTFNLERYSATDNPTLYFNYYLETEQAGHNPDVPVFMRDSFRVFAAGDDGVWHLLGTNNGNRFAGLNDDEFDLAPRRIQEEWDNTNTWRQARIPLGNFAGRNNVRLRFDFSTAGSMNVGNYTQLNGRANTPTNGDELRAVDGTYLRDAQNFDLSAPGIGGGERRFELDLGYTLVAPSGRNTPDGARLSIDGVNFEFDSNGTVTPGFRGIAFEATDSPAQVAQRIAAAIAAAPLTTPVQVNNNRINLRGGPAGAVVGANVVTATGMPATFVEGAPGVTGGTIRVNVHAGMNPNQVREAIALVMSGVYAQGDRAQIKTHDEIVRLIGYRWIRQNGGPNADPLNSRLLGITNTLPGDRFGAFNASANPDNTRDNDDPGALRGQANGFEGLYIDDIIIGFAERGEMVTGANTGNTDYIVNPQADDTNIPIGAYELEVRRAAEAGFPVPPPLPELILFNQIDTNDRLTPSRTLLAPAGGGLADGQFFSLSDGVNTLTFEFNDLTIPGSGVTQGRVRIDFRPSETAPVVAQRITSVINSPQVQSVLKISAQLSDGVVGANGTSNQINLIGPVSIPNPGSGISVITALPTGPEVDRGTLIDNDTAASTIGHFEVRPGAGGSIGTTTPGSQSGVTVRGKVQTFANQEFIFQALNYIDVGPNGGAIDLSTTTITQVPTLIGEDLVESRGTFQGTQGVISWIVLTRIDDGSRVVSNTVSLSSPQPLGELRFVNYLDEDVFNIDDDLLYQVGTPGQADFRLYTLDNAERVGFAQGGVYVAGPGLVNASYDGFAADAFDDLRQAITGPGTLYSVFGNIDIVDLPQRVDTTLGPINGLADVTTAMSWTINPTAFTATITTFLELLPQEATGALNFVTYTEQYGDRNLFRDQGQIILQNNEIRNSAQWGIQIDAAPRTPADGNSPHPGAVRNLRELNVDRLVPGVVVTNNVIHNNGLGGIRISGDPAIDAPQPFGRILNNTIYGQGGTLTGGGQADIGIRVDQNAAPTLLNNIVANLNTGVSVDASSQARTVLGGMLFQGNDTNSNVGLGGSFPIALTNSQPLFVNAAAGNFYLQALSPAIDSSVDSLLDRPGLVTVRNPLGILQSPILAPDRDNANQLRVDDPGVSTPQGVGLNPFKDRGAIDRVDFAGPAAGLINPPDNDAEGTDLDPAPNTVVRSNDIIRDFRISLFDRFDPNGTTEGSDIDDLTVTRASVRLEVISGPTPVLQLEGTHYAFSYDATSNIIVLTPSGGVWPLGQTYRITLDNSPLTGIKDQAGNVLLPNETDGSHIYTIFLGSAIDFGDAPDSYQTLLASGGPSHQVVPGKRLGASVGAESDGQPSALANLDPSDDGVSNFLLARGATSSFTVLATDFGKIDAWMDLNQDGDFGDSGEYLVQGVNVATPGTAQIIGFTLPDGPQGDTILRVRYSTLGSTTPGGAAADGEVEDYQVTIGGPAFHNPGALGFDVNNDAKVDVVDLLVLINFITVLQLRLDPSIPNNIVATLPPTSPPYLDPPPVFDPSGGGVPAQGKYVDVAAPFGRLDTFDLLAMINYITLNFQPEGEGGGEGEFAAPAEMTVGAGMSAAASSGRTGSSSDMASLLAPASLLASPNIVLEVRERAGFDAVLDDSPLGDDSWLAAGDDDATLGLIAAGATADHRTASGLFPIEQHSRRKAVFGALDEEAWDNLLTDLAFDAGGLVGDDGDDS